MVESGPKQPENRMHLFDPVGLINDNYAQYGVRPRHATSNAATGGGLKFAVEAAKAIETDSANSSPRLWKPDSSASNSPPTSPRFTSSPQQPSQNPSHSHQSPESMSPNSRTQAIARGRRELMDMIKDMPESYYELSLRDIVEQRPPSSPPPPPPASLATVGVRQPSQESNKKVEVVDKKIVNQETHAKEKKNKKTKKEGRKKKVGKSESKKKMMKNRSVDNGGFLLKTTVFPIPFRSKKSKRGLSPAPSFKVATKSSSKGTERRWWVRKSRVSNENEIENVVSASTSRSSSIVSRHKQSIRFLPSCCAFFNDKKIKAKK